MSRMPEVMSLWHLHRNSTKTQQLVSSKRISSRSFSNVSQIILCFWISFWNLNSFAISKWSVIVCTKLFIPWKCTRYSFNPVGVGLDSHSVKRIGLKCIKIKFLIKIKTKRTKGTGLFMIVLFLIDFIIFILTVK